MQLKGSDFMYLALGVAAFYLVAKNQKPLSNTLTATTGVVNPLLAAAGQGASIVTDPESWKPQNYAMELLKAPFSTKQAWDLFLKQPGFSTLINAQLTTLGVMK